MHIYMGITFVTFHSISVPVPLYKQIHLPVIKTQIILGNARNYCQWEKREKSVNRIVLEFGYYNEGIHNNITINGSLAFYRVNQSKSFSVNVVGMFLINCPTLAKEVFH